ncbi:DEAD/DEAH box helicase [Microvirga pudoricolor]|uniref:DEAD/DEAH box helicase n=1 Tax=Microvirga pudoricolor TaxID=2778729 RepID=UPI0019508FD0|nr:DEAD/DEAH box helicase [Microvirga pudoricolor]MBM6592566.1 DEAD/DEAH box helicase [Microvirga pudoricolor]
MTLFTDFGLAEPLLKALAAEGYEKPTPIQAQTIPLALEGRDVCGIAQTGTGKTAAFALPILNHLAKTPKPLPRKGCRVLVLSPTRELAGQIADSFRTYGRNLRVKTAVVFGGVNLPRQEREMATGVDVLVATPGRLLDLIDRRALSLRDVEILVLDEADQMLDLGFIHALKRIVTMLPKDRQSLFFSATMPKTISSLADDFLRNPAKVAVTPVATTAERVEQGVMFVSTGRKQPLLEILLRDPAIDRVLVFTRTKHGADKVVRGLEKAGISGAAIHGNKSQPARERALAAFRDGSCRVLVATDIAARGIDVEGVTHVINFDLPNVPESYVHRIGRTARAGAAGQAISFCNKEEKAFLSDIQKLTRQTVPVLPMPEGFAAGDLDADAPIPQRGGGRPQPHARGQKPQGHGASRQNDAQAERGPKRRRSRGGKPGGQAAGGQTANTQRSVQGRPGSGGAKPQGSAPRPVASTQPFRRQEGRSDGAQVAWLDKGPRR